MSPTKSSSKYVIFAVCCVSLLLSTMSGTSVSVAFPVITSTFNTSLVVAGWILSINSLVGAVVMPLAGRAGEIFGIKKAYLMSLILFTVGSLLCAIAPNIPLLIAFRFIQSIGNTGFMPLAVSIVAEKFPQSRQRAVGLLTSTFTIGMLIGPNLGGWLVSTYGWSSVFWLNVPFGIILFVGTILVLRPSPRSKNTLDLVSVGLFAGVLFTLIAGFSELDNFMDASWVIPIVLFAVAVILAVLFFKHEKRSQSKIIDAGLLTFKPFVGSNLYFFTSGFAMMGVSSFLPLFLVKVYGMSTLESGILLTPRSAGTMIAAVVSSFFLTRWGYRWPMLIGLLLSAFCLVILSMEYQAVNILGLHLNAAIWISLVMFGTGIGMGIGISAADNVGIDLMPERAGVITGMKGLFRNMGGAIGVALVSLVLDKTGQTPASFQIVFIVVSALFILTIPLLFIMPKNPASRYSY